MLNKHKNPQNNNWLIKKLNLYLKKYIVLLPNATEIYLVS